MIEFVVGVLGAVVLILVLLLTYVLKATPSTSVSQCNQHCRQGRDCDCYQRSCDMAAEEYDKLC